MGVTCIFNIVARRGGHKIFDHQIGGSQKYCRGTFGNSWPPLFQRKWWPPYVVYSAVQRQKGITDNFFKIELLPLPGPEWQYLSVEIIKQPILNLQTLKMSVPKMRFMYKSMGAKHSNWQLSQNNQYVSYALLSLRGSIVNSIISRVSHRPLYCVMKLLEILIFPQWCYTCQIPGGGTQLWVGYGCAARSFDHHPITKPEKTQICYLYKNHSFLEGPFLKPISAFYNVNWDA